MTVLREVFFFLIALSDYRHSVGRVMSCNIRIFIWLKLMLFYFPIFCILPQKGCKCFKDVSPALCYYGASGILCVGLAVNISALLHMLCCRCQVLQWWLFFVKTPTLQTYSLLSGSTSCITADWIFQHRWVFLLLHFCLTEFHIKIPLTCWTGFSAEKALKAL